MQMFFGKETDFCFVILIVTVKVRNKIILEWWRITWPFFGEKKKYILNRPIEMHFSLTSYCHTCLSANKLKDWLPFWLILDMTASVYSLKSQKNWYFTAWETMNHFLVSYFIIDWIFCGWQILVLFCIPDL